MDVEELGTTNGSVQILQWRKKKGGEKEQHAPQREKHSNGKRQEKGSQCVPTEKRHRNIVK